MSDACLRLRAPQRANREPRLVAGLVAVWTFGEPVTPPLTVFGVPKALRSRVHG